MKLLSSSFPKYNAHLHAEPHFRKTDPSILSTGRIDSPGQTIPSTGWSTLENFQE